MTPECGQRLRRRDKPEMPRSRPFTERRTDGLTGVMPAATRSPVRGHGARWRGPGRRPDGGPDPGGLTLALFPTSGCLDPTSPTPDVSHR